MTSAELKNHPVTQSLASIQTKLGLKDPQFVKALGIDLHGANWGKILASTYNGNHSKILIKLQVAMEAYQNPGSGITEEGVIIFSHVQDSINAMQIAVDAADGDEHRMVIIAGPKGSGKTKTITLCNHRFPGAVVEALPSWGGSYYDFLVQFAAGLEIKGTGLRSKGAYEMAILSDLKHNPRPIYIDELNYFSAHGFNLLKSIMNKTRAPVLGATIPRYLTTMATGKTAQEFAQLVRRTVAINHIPIVTEREVFQLQKAFFPKILITAEQAREIAKESNLLFFMDSVHTILDDCETSADVSISIGTHRRSKQVTLNATAA